MSNPGNPTKSGAAKPEPASAATHSGQTGQAGAPGKAKGKPAAGQTPGGNGPAASRTGPGPGAEKQAAGGRAPGAKPGATVTSIPTATAVAPINVQKAQHKAAMLRKARLRATIGRLALWVGLPTVLAVIYYGFVVTPRYESIALVTVQSTDSGTPHGLESLVGAVGRGASDRDAMIVTEYVLSRHMLGHLNADGGFTRHFGAADVDYISRLPPDASAEDAYDYYLRRINAEYDSLSGIVTFTVEAFSPQEAETIAKELIESSETMVNGLSERVQQDQTRYATDEVKRAEKRLLAARAALLELQKSNADFSPGQSATEALSVRGQIQGELARARADLAQARAFMQPGAPKVVALSQRVSSLVGQVKRENRRLVNTDETGLNASLVQFEEAALEKEFAEKTYASALSALEMVRLEAAQQHRYLATIAPPSTAEESTRPPRLLRVFSVLALALAFFAIATMLGAAVREHARL